MSRTWNVAIVGATGAVGAALLTILQDREFPIGKIAALVASDGESGTASFGNHEIAVADVATFDFSKTQIAFFSAGTAVSAEHAVRAAAAGCVVIDNSSQFRRDDDVPLIVPEVNSQAIGQFRQRRIIANPTCSTTQLLLALKPLHDAAGIERINIATYQAVSGSGPEGVEALGRQTADLLNFRPVEVSVYPRQIAFNVIPQVDEFQDNGYTLEEMKLLWETRRILGDETILVNATAVRVPVFYGHSQAVHIETKRKLGAAEARALLQKAPGVAVVDAPQSGDFPTAVSDASGEDAVFVGRIREDISHPRGLDLWIVADNIRKGAALNMVQIAELLIHGYL